MSPMNERIRNIDLIRGIALLGLPMMNIIVFAMPFAAYLNPTAYGNDDFLNHTLFVFFHLFADQKFMGLFSLLFGASMLLLIEKLESSGRTAWKIHYSRTFWLLVIGFCHFWFLWEGDVLMFYAVASLVLFPFRHLPARNLLLVSAITMAGAIYFESIGGLSEEQLGKEGREALELLYSPTEQQIAELRSIYTGSYQQVTEYVRGTGGDDSQTENTGDIAIAQLALSGLLRAFAMMCLGMALYRMGWLSGGLSISHYRRQAVAGLAIGLPIIALGLVMNYANNWQLEHFFRWGMLPNTAGTVAVVIAYVALISLWFKSQLAEWLKKAVQCVGRMALTNYLSQSVICALIFYGYGLGWYGELTRLQLLPIIAGIVITQLIFSRLWLHVFLQGPVEWLWRSLTYFRPAPLLRPSHSMLSDTHG